MHTEQIKRINDLLIIYLDDFPFHEGGEWEELKLTEESSKDELMARLSLLVNKGFNINSVFDPRYDMVLLPNEYEQHFVEDMMQLTEINQNYKDKGYNVQAIEWQENKIATFHITR